MQAIENIRGWAQNIAPMISMSTGKEFHVEELEKAVVDKTFQLNFARWFHNQKFSSQSHFIKRVKFLEENHPHLLQLSEDERQYIDQFYDDAQDAYEGLIKKNARILRFTNGDISIEVAGQLYDEVIFKIIRKMKDFYTRMEHRGQTYNPEKTRFVRTALTKGVITKKDVENLSWFYEKVLKPDIQNAEHGWYNVAKHRVTLMEKFKAM